MTAVVARSTASRWRSRRAAGSWPISGGVRFHESVIGEVAPFGVGITMVERGTVRTGFGAAMTVAEPLDVSKTTRVGRVRRYLGGAGTLTGDAPGDPARVARAAIDSAGVTPARAASLSAASISPAAARSSPEARPASASAPPAPWRPPTPT
ncbi:hypothetical protein AB0K15_10540 [Amycolatopsis sp. NPDC049253]|uniref:hypothetical protein n=1 Tax=Amycolatopsis sp. NPDC049253 TaxID=3155274 RepID=UPI00342F1B91